MARGRAGGRGRRGRWGERWGVRKRASARERAAAGGARRSRRLKPRPMLRALVDASVRHADVEGSRNPRHRNLELASELGGRLHSRERKETLGPKPEDTFGPRNRKPTREEGLSLHTGPKQKPRKNGYSVLKTYLSLSKEAPDYTQVG